MERIPELSIMTTAIVCGFISLMTFIVVLTLFTARRMKEGSNLIWAAAFALRGIGSILVVLRGRIGPFFSISLANILIMCCLALFFSGTSAFLGKGRRLGLVLGYCLAASGLVLWLGNSGYEFGMRAAFVSLIEAIPEYASGGLLIFHKTKGSYPLAKATAAVFCACASILAARAFFGFMTPHAKSIFQPGPILTLGCIEAILGSAVLAILFLSMANARDKLEDQALRKGLV